MNKKFKVAIVCHTYNHEKFISQTIDSFLNQITDFNFQIIIHDDFSTDATPKILEQYKQNNSKIYLFLQRENQFSKGSEGKKNIFNNIKSLIDAEYVATCEGDDYWIDNFKLAKQVKFLDYNLEYSASTHLSMIYDEKKNRFNGKTGWKKTNITSEEMILGGGGIVPSASLVMREKYYDLPPFGINASFGDYQLQIFCTLNGKVYNFKNIMSVYRINHPLSWTSRMNTSENFYKNDIYNSEIIMLKELNSYTSNKFDKIISLKIAENNLIILQNESIGNFASINMLKIASLTLSNQCNKSSGITKIICRSFLILKEYFKIQFS